MGDSFRYVNNVWIVVHVISVFLIPNLQQTKAPWLLSATGSMKKFSPAIISRRCFILVSGYGLCSSCFQRSSRVSWAVSSNSRASSSSRLSKLLNDWLTVPITHTNINISTDCSTNAPIWNLHPLRTCGRYLKFGSSLACDIYRFLIIKIKVNL